MGNSFTLVVSVWGNRYALGKCVRASQTYTKTHITVTLEQTLVNLQLYVFS